VNQTEKPATEKKKEVTLVPLYFYGKRYEAPESFTIMQAYEFTGHQYTRGCGCRGGACGACAALFIMPGSPALQVGLACQTQVVAGMFVVQLPYFPTRKRPYELGALTATTASISQSYPELLNCMGCNTCTKMCPQEIKVMECMSAALRGDITSVAVESMSCVMCGLCAARCPAELSPYHITLLGRRLYGKYLQPRYRNLPSRLKAIEEKEFDERLDELMAADKETLTEVYKKQQADKRII
jgi:ferredoxin